MPTKKLTALSIFILTLVFYLSTLLPSLAWGDGVKLQSEAIAGESFVLAEMTPDEFSPDPFIFSRVGVAAWDHPLYIIIGHLLVRIFTFVDSLWLVNFISALFGAISVALLFLLVHHFTNSLFGSTYASLSLAVSHTFWWHSSTPEVYTLFVFLLLLSFYFFEKFERTNRYAFPGYGAFFFGLAASTHVMAFLAVPALGLYYLIGKSYRGLNLFDFRRLREPTFGFIAGFSIYLIQFIRMSTNFPLNEIMGPVVGSTFLSQLGTFSPIVFAQSLLSYLFFLMVQFGPVGILFGIFGFRKILQHADLSLRKIVTFFLVFALFGILYRVTDQFTFFIASYVFWAMLMGIGVNHILSLMPGKRHFFLSSLLTLSLLTTPFFYTTLPGLAEKYGLNDASIGIPEIGIGVRNGLAYYIDPNKRGDYDAYEFGTQSVSNLAPNAMVIAEWYTDTDEYFILRYFTKVDRLRSDIAVVGWPTRDPFSFDSQLAVDVVKDSLPHRPIYLASLSDRFYDASKLIEMYCVVPENNLYRLYPRENNNFPCLKSDSVTE